MKKTITLFSLVLFIFVAYLFLTQKGILTPNVIYAETENVEIDLSEHLTLGNGQRLAEQFATPASMINLLIRVVFVGVGLILLAMIIISGLSMIAAGTTESKDKASTTMTSALMGFLVIFAAYWILQIIQIFTGVNLGF
ncbi:hypothetical protein KBB59_01155 [Candidatus Woesebacteria bacterium]|jgi:thiosulfate reductase cytochrome b subunit|nr:hypothetical protein [Candidatus Woesebacteria bacterium]HNV45098.1 hypothetical protein [Candidatus Woesebacteria bacterium]HOA11759.1 hypothetical protein [Candidatus Woesebacteria bacterium]HOC07800.1 hypothetical protein [Candidatus Woesebacteria bacterium]HOI04856.1 hypothetical protein [Candidatus Woesebacteria bacterium]